MADGVKTARVTNTYDSKPTEVQDGFKVRKVLVGRAWQDDETFTAELYSAVRGADGTIAATGSAIDTVTFTKSDISSSGDAVSEAHLAFAGRSYDKAGTYYYVVREKLAGADDYLDYSRSSYGVTVVVGNNAQTNQLEVASTTVRRLTDRTGAKDLNNTLVADGEAYFTNVYTVPDADKDAKTVQAAGKDAAGAYVSVGQELTYTVKWNNDAIDSTGAATRATVTVTDTLPAGVTLDADSLEAGKGVAQSVTFDEATRTITWELGERAIHEKGSVTFRVRVNESAFQDVQGKALEAGATADLVNGATVTLVNTMGTTTKNVSVTNHARTGDLSVTKELDLDTEGMSDEAKAQLEASEFTFTFDFFTAETAEVEGVGTAHITPLAGSYAYEVFEKDAGGSYGTEPVASGTVTNYITDPEHGSVTMRAGQKVVVYGLPEGTYYIAGEDEQAGFAPNSPDNAMGTIAPATTQSVQVDYVNSNKAEYTPTAQKVLAGEGNKGLQEGAFKFYAKVTPLDDTPQDGYSLESDAVYIDEQGAVSAPDEAAGKHANAYCASNGAAGQDGVTAQVTFEKIYFNAPGRYQVSIFEEIPDSSDEGRDPLISYDTHTYSYVIAVTQAQDGGLSVTPEDSSVTGLRTFTNTWTGQQAKSVDVTAGDGTLIEDADGKLVGVGDVLTYRVSWVNNATDDEGRALACDKVTVTDRLPAGVDLVADSLEAGRGDAASVSFDETTRTVTWVIGTGEADSVAKGARGELSFQVIVNNDAAIAAGAQGLTNQARVTVGDSAQRTNVVKNPVAQKTVTTDTSAGVQVGDTLAFRVVVGNDKDQAADVVLTDVLSRGLTFVTSGDADQYLTATANEDGTTTLVWAFPGAAAGWSQTISYSVRVNDKALALDEMTNTATIQVGSDPTVTTNTVEIPLPQTSVLDIVKLTSSAVDGIGPEAGDFTFQITLQDKAGNPVSGQFEWYDWSWNSGTLVFDENGVATLTLSCPLGGFNDATIQGLPAGAVFKVEEINLPQGWTCDSQLEQSGAITSPDEPDTAAVGFENTYRPDPVVGSGLFSAGKILSGRDWLDDEAYTFKLAPYTGDTLTGQGGSEPMPLNDDGDVLDTVTVTKDSPVSEGVEGADGTVDGAGVRYASFGDISFDSVGYYTYVITETGVSADANLTFSQAKWIVQVMVGQGRRYDADLGIWVADGSAMAVNSVICRQVVADDGTDLGESGDWAYIYRMGDPDNAELDDPLNPENDIDARGVSDAHALSCAFTNTYKAPTPTKDVADASTATPEVSVNGQAVQVGDVLTYTISWANTAVDSTGAAQAAKVVVTDDVPAGTEYVDGSARFVGGSEGQGATIETGTDPENGRANVTWTMPSAAANAAGSVSFQVRVTADVLSAAAGQVVNDRAKVAINDGPSVEVEATQNTVRTGELAVEKRVLPGTSGAKAPTDRDFTFVVTLKDARGGALTGSYAYTVEETVSGQTGDEDAVMLADAQDDGAQQASVELDANGSCRISIKAGQRFTITGLPEGATYEVLERVSAGFTQTVPADGGTYTGSIVAGRLVQHRFTNTFDPAPARLSSQATLGAGKLLVGRDWGERETFAFALTVLSPSTAPLPAQTQVSVSGTDEVNNYASALFGDIAFTQVGTYNYRITEVDESAQKQGLTYSKARYNVQVVVALSADASKLEITSVTMTQAIDDAGASTARRVTADAQGNLVGDFTNTYSAPSPSKDVAKDGESVDGKLVGVGDVLTYTVSWVNNAYDDEGKPTAADVTVTDRIPAGTVLVEGSASDPGVYDAATGTLTWTLGTQDACAQGTVSFQVRVDDSAAGVEAVSNTASVKVGSNSPQVTNKVTNTTPKKTVDRGGTSVAGDVQVGDELTYTVTWANTEAGTAHVVVSDALPAGLTFVSASEPGTASAGADGQTVVTWDLGEQEAGASGEVTLTVRVNENAVVEGSADNSASVKVGDRPAVKTNTVDAPGVKTAKLAVVKYVATDGSGAVPDPDETFTVDVTLADEAGEMLAGTYNYLVYDVDGNPVTDESGTQLGGSVQAGRGSVTLKADQAAVFYDVPAGTRYTVAEELAEGAYWRVRYTNPEGTVNPHGSDDVTQAIVTNTYTTTPATLVGAESLVVEKTLTGRLWESKETYEFGIEPDTGASQASIPMPASSRVTVGQPAGADGTVNTNTGSFGDITYTKVGQYSYIITETGTTASGSALKNSQARYRVVVSVTDAGKGKLEASATMTQLRDDSGTAVSTPVDDLTARFTNTFTPAEVTKEVHSGTTSASKVSIDGQSVEVGGYVWYSISWVNDAVDEKGVPCEAVVTVSDTLPAGMRVDWSSMTGLPSNSRITVSEGGMRAPVEGAPESTGVSQAFTVTIGSFDSSSGIGDPVPAGASGTITFRAQVTEAAMWHRTGATSAEVIPGAELKNAADVCVTSTTGLEVKRTTNTVVNTLEAGDLVISKTVDEGETGAELPDDEFEFTVELSYTDARTGSIKALEGSYKYAGTLDGTTPVKGTVGSGGTITLKAGGSVTIADLPEGTHYAVSETSPAGWSQSATTPNGDIVADQACQASYVNTWTPGALVLTPQFVTKVLAGGREPGLQAGEFTFEFSIEPADGDTPADGFTYAIDPETGEEYADARTGTNDAQGRVNFAHPVTFSKVGNYTMKCWEVVPQEGDEGYDPLISYDTTVLEGTVVISSDDNGNLKVSYVIPAGERFTNTWEGNQVEKDVDVTFASDGTTAQGADGVLVGQDDVLTYTVKWQNSAMDETGKAVAAQVRVTDSVPAGCTYVAGSAKVNGAAAARDEFSFDEQTGALTWTFGTQDEPVAAAATGTVSFQVKVTDPLGTESLSTGGGVVRNTAQVYSNDACVSTNTVSNPVTRKTVTSNTQGLRLGDEVKFSITAANLTGKSADVVVTDWLPAGLTYESANPRPMSVAPYEDGTTLLTWEFVSRPTGETGEIEITATVNQNAFKQEFDEDGLIQTPEGLTSNTATVQMGHNPGVSTNTTPDVEVHAGGLYIAKSVTVEGAGSAPDTEFVFDVTLIGPNETPLCGVFPTMTYDADGEGAVGEVELDSGGYTQVTLKAGQGLEIYGLPQGTAYTVSEEPSLGGWTQVMPADSASATGTIYPDADVAANFVNEYTAPVKTVTGADGSDADSAANGDAAVQVGDVLTYTVAWTNAASPSRVVVRDSVPAGTEFVEGSALVDGQAPADGVFTLGQDGSLTWDLGETEAAGGAVSFQVRVTRDALTCIDNTASVQVGQDGPTFSTNTTTTPVEPDDAKHVYAADGALLDGRLVSVGDTLAFEVQWANTAQNDGGTVRVTDTLPAGLELVDDAEVTDAEDTPGSVRHNADGTTTVKWNINGVAAGARGALTYHARVTAAALEAEGAELTNTATIAKGSASVDVSSTNPVPERPAKSVYGTVGNQVTADYDGRLVAAGSVLEYRVSWTNTSDYAVSDVRLTDTVPAGTTFVEGSASADGAGASVAPDDSGTFTWAFGQVDAGATVTAAFRVKVDAQAANVNVVDNTAYLEIGPNGSAISSNTTHNGTVGKTVGEGAWSASGDAQVGDELTYTIGWANLTGAVADVTVTDALPVGLDFVGASDDAALSADGKTVTWSLGAQEADASGTVTLTVRVSQAAVTAGATDNTATVKVGTKPAVNTNVVPGPVVGTGSLAVSKAVQAAQGSTAPADAQFAFTVSLTDPATGAQLAGSYAYRLFYADGTPVEDAHGNQLGGSIASGGTLNLTAGTYALVEGLPVGSAYSVLETGMEAGFSPVSPVDADGKGVAASGTVSSDTAEAAFVNGFTVPAPVKQVLKDGEGVDGQAVTPGDVLTYSVSWTNTGTVDVENVVLGDVVPTGTELVEGSATLTVAGQAAEGDFFANEGGTLTWNVGSVAPGASVEATFQVRVSEGVASATVENTATVRVGGHGPYASNTTRNPVDGKVLSTDVSTGVKVGDVLAYEVGYANDQDTAAVVTVTDVLPAGLAYVEGSATGPEGAAFSCMADGQGIQTLTWSFEAQPGQQGSVAFSASVTSDAVDAGSTDNTASIQVGDRPAISTNTVPAPVVRTSSLVISKAVTSAWGGRLDPSVYAGSEFTFELVLTDPARPAAQVSGTYAVELTDADGNTVADAPQTVETSVDAQGRNVIQVTLEANQSITISGIPEGLAYEVRELTDADHLASGWRQLAPVDEAGTACGYAGSMSADDAVHADFTNAYGDPDAGATVALSATKTLLGRDQVDGEFGFAVTTRGAAEGADDEYTVLSGTSAATLDGQASPIALYPTEFATAANTLAYDHEILDEAVELGYASVVVEGKEWLVNYTIGEFADEDLLPAGVTPAPGSATSYDFAVKVADDGEGGLTATLVDTQGNPIEGSFAFTNVYSAAGTLGGDGQTSIAATKTLAGRDAAQGEFSFTACEADGMTDAAGASVAGTAVASALNPASANGVAGALAFGKVGYTLVAATSEHATYVTDGYAAVTRGEDGAFRFAYEVSEATGQGSLPAGVSAVAGASSYTVEVVVSDNADGTLSASVVYPEGTPETGLAFQNTYLEGTQASVSVDASKYMEGLPEGAYLASGDYSFTLAPTDAQADPHNPAQTATVVAAGDEATSGTVHFGLVYEVSDLAEAAVAQDGSRQTFFTYTLREVEPESGAAFGVTYDRGCYYVTVLVRDDGQGNLSAAVTDVSYAAEGAEEATSVAFDPQNLAATIAFTNTYKADEVMWAPVAWKTTLAPTGADLSGVTFSYLVTTPGSDGSLVRVGGGTSGADGEVAFDRFKVPGEGTYTYYISELASGASDDQAGTAAEDGTVRGGITYDATTYMVRLTVTRSGNGTYDFEAHYYLNGDESQEVWPYASDGSLPGGVVFTNTYVSTGTSLELYARKTMDGPHSLGGFQFRVTDENGTEVANGTSDEDGNVTFGKIYYADAVPETPTTLEDGSVLNTDGTVTHPDGSVTHADGSITYPDGSVKRADGTLVAADGTMTAPDGTVTYADGTVVAPDGTTTYADGTVKRADGTIVSPDGTVTNPDGTVVTPGTDTGSDTDDQGDATDGADGSDGSSDQADGADGSFDATVPETGDGPTGEQGESEAEPEASAEPEAADELQEQAEAADVAAQVAPEQAEALEAVEPVGESLLASIAVADDQGAEPFVADTEAAQFDEVSQGATDGGSTGDQGTTGTTPGAEGGTGGSTSQPTYKAGLVEEHWYTVSEVDTGLEGVTYDRTAWLVHVSVTDDGTGQLTASVDQVVERSLAADGSTYDTPRTGLDDVVFENSYKATRPAEVRLTGAKTLVGRDTQAGEFTFTVTDDATGAVAAGGQTSSDASDGQAVPISFGKLSFAEAGQYSYTVAESRGGTTVNGVAYDSATYRVVVDVVDQGDGSLAASVASVTDANGAEVGEGGIAFTNRYSAAGEATVTLEGTKELTGRDAQAGEFTFLVRDASGAIVATGVSAAARAGEGAAIDFGALHFSAAGEYAYTVSELNGGRTLDNVTYDASSFAVTVRVTDNLDGTLAAAVDYQSGSILFKNVYTDPNPSPDPHPTPTPDPTPTPTPDSGNTPTPGGTTPSGGTTGGATAVPKTGDATDDGPTAALAGVGAALSLAGVGIALGAVRRKREE